MLRDEEFSYTSSSPSVSPRPNKVSRRFERAIERLISKRTLSHKWRRPSHINQLETEALLLAAWHIASCPSTRGHRIISLIYNTKTLGAVAKGRSSSFVINRSCHKLTSVLFRANIALLPHWVPSKLNLAHNPSRAFENVITRRAAS